MTEMSYRDNRSAGEKSRGLRRCRIRRAKYDLLRPAPVARTPRPRPHFRNGAAADLHEVVNFYSERFSMQLTKEQKSDLVAFLNSL